MHYFNNCSNGLIVTSNGLKHLKHNAVSTGVKIDRGVYLSRINQMPDSQDSRVWSIPVGVVRQVHTVPCKLMPNGGNATSVQKCRHYPSRVVRIAVKSNYELIILCHEFCTGRGNTCAHDCATPISDSLVFSPQGWKREPRRSIDRLTKKRRRFLLFRCSSFHFPSRKDSWRLVSGAKVACSCWQKTRNSTSKSGEKIS